MSAQRQRFRQALTLSGTAVIVTGLAVAILLMPDQPPADPPAPQQTSSMHGPSLVKLGFRFDTNMRHPMDCKQGTAIVPCKSTQPIPFADSKTGDRVQFVLLRNGKSYQTASIALPGGPLDTFWVVTVLPEVDIPVDQDVTFSASMTRTSWHGKGPIPEWEKRINANSMIVVGSDSDGSIDQREPIGSRAYSAELDGGDARMKRRAVRP